ncbi:hypothetical protein [Actibacterium sp.]|uniref:hypothetical protein n=1 Tax=Actibacterium sp. TaxID=1872125 RepID=UPI003569302B
MKFSVLMASALALALVCAAPVNAAKVTREIPVTEDFRVSKHTLNGVPSYEVRLTVIVVDGIFELCGVIVRSPQAEAAIVRTFVRGGVLKIDDKVAIRDFTYFSWVKRKSDLAKTPAKCASTGIKKTQKHHNFHVEFTVKTTAT